MYRLRWQLDVARFRITVASTIMMLYKSFSITRVQGMDGRWPKPPLCPDDSFCTGAGGKPSPSNWLPPEGLVQHQVASSTFYPQRICFGAKISFVSFLEKNGVAVFLRFNTFSNNRSGREMRSHLLWWGKIWQFESSRARFIANWKKTQSRQSKGRVLAGMAASCTSVPYHS